MGQGWVYGVELWVGVGIRVGVWGRGMAMGGGMARGMGYGCGYGELLWVGVSNAMGRGRGVAMCMG